MRCESWLESVECISDCFEDMSVLLPLAEVQLDVAKEVEQCMNDSILELCFNIQLRKCHPVNRQHCLLTHRPFYLQILLKLVPFLSIQTVHSVFQLIPLKMLEILCLYLQQDPLEERANYLKERFDEIEIDARKGLDLDIEADVAWVFFSEE